MEGEGSDCFLNLRREGCPPTPLYPELSSKLRMAHAFFKGSILERRTSLITYMNVKFSTITDLKMKDAETLLFKSFVKRCSFRVKCRAAAELCFLTSDGQELGFVTASSSLVAILCPEQEEGIPAVDSGGFRGFFLLLLAPLRLCNPSQADEHW